MRDDDPQYSPGQAALITGTSRRTVLAAMASGELPVVRYNSRVIRVSRQALLAWIVGRTTREAHNSHKSSQLAQLKVASPRARALSG